MDKKRERGDNWSKEEKELLLEIMCHSGAIIDSKRTDTNSNKQKSLEWINVQRKFYELSGIKREVAQLKGAWRRLRIGAKKRLGEHNRGLNATGGGQKPLSPTDEDKKIMAICLTDFLVENNIYDSDGIFNEKLDYKKQKESEEICDDEKKERDSKPKVQTTKCKKFELSQKANILQSNSDIKEKTMALIKEEYNLKIKYQKQELYQQELRHKLEIELLMMEKEKKSLEIQLLKAKCNI